MRKKLIAGNWKMHGNRQSAIALAKDIAAGIATAKNGLPEIAVFPPFTYLDAVGQALANSPIHWGAQTVSEYADGAYTGQISLAMLADLGCHYTLIGHSECRHYNAETNDSLARAFANVLASKVIPLLCVGEQLADREAGNTTQVITQQVQACITPACIGKKIVIAYEPVWAIGTGKTASPAQAQEVHALIRQLCQKIDKNLAQTTQILYGGSVNPDNAAELMSLPDVDGVLVGGCSLHYEQFLSIINTQLSVTVK